MTAAATRSRRAPAHALRASLRAQSRSAGVAARELPRDAAAARTALQRELHRFVMTRFRVA
jgi:hypothetical protein